MARGTKLWQAAGSPIIQGRSRTERPFWRDAVTAVPIAGLCGALADAVVSTPYALSWSEVVEFAGAFLVSVGIALVPTLLFVWIGRRMGWSRVSTVAGVVGGVIAAAYVAGGWRFFT